MNKSFVKKYSVLKSDQAGFTLLELMVTASIGLLLLITVMSIDVFTKRNFVVNSALNNTQSATRLAMDWMTKDLRAAVSVVSVHPTNNQYTTSNSQLVLMLPSIDINGNALAVYDYVVYRADPAHAARLQRILDVDALSRRNNGNDQTWTIIDSLKTLDFKSGGTGLSGLNLANVSKVEVAITSEKKTLENKTVSEDLTSVIRLRNK